MRQPSPPSSTAAPRTPGARVGPYELRAPLGKGGSGEVWEALLHGPGGFRKPVALKMLLTSHRHAPSYRKMLLREARLGGRIQHPHVVSTLLVGEHDDVLCVALELVRGLPLSAVGKATGPLSGTALVDAGVPLATALHHVHTFRVDGRPAGLVHRDVKPENVLVDRFGVVKLADLGISLLRGESGEVAGTLGYAPVEQFEGRASPASDLFAYGVTLFRLASGRRPFGSGRRALFEMTTVERRLADPTFLAPVDEALPGLGAIVRDCLRADPGDRPASAELVAHAVAALRPHARGPSLSALLAKAAPSLWVEEVSTTASQADTRVAPSGNLPPPRDPFVGRERELDAVQQALDTSSWAVLLGPGGLGKTRLALEVARRQQQALQGGAWVFELAEARSVRGVCTAVASGLGVPLDSADPVEQLGRALGARGRCLVVLDNLEPCLQAVVEALPRWRALAPEARFLGTSRVRPGLPDEAVVPLEGLSADDAAELFRARAPRALADDEAPRVSELCEAVDRMPLAIELAAARLSLLRLPVLIERLGLALLGGRSRDRPGRHQSVKASIRWSWELLSPPAAAALLQLSVFDGSFDLAAAEAVLSLGDDAPWALDALQELIDASQVRVDPATGRFATWMAVRAFGAAMLPYPERRAAEERHGAHYAGLPAHYGPALTAELDHLVSACRRALTRGDGDLAAAALDRVGVVLDRRGPRSAWVDLADEVARMPLTGPARAVVARCRAFAHWRTGGDRSLTRLRRALDIAHEEGHASEIATCTAQLARAAAEMGDPEALRHYRHARALFQRLGNRRYEGILLTGYGVHRKETGHGEDAESLYRRALALHRAVGNGLHEGITLSNLGVLMMEQGRLDEAEGSFRAASALHEGLGDVLSVAVVHANLGVVARRRGRPAEARVRYEKALTTYRSIGESRLQAVVLANLGNLARASDDLDGAEAFFTEARALALQVESPRTAAWALARLGELDLARGNPAACLPRLEEAAATFRAVRDPHHHAEVLGLLAQAHHAAGDLERARHTLAEGQAVAPADTPIDSLQDAQARLEDVT